MFKIVFRPSVEKDLRGVPDPIIELVIDKIAELSNNPYAHQSLKLSSTEKTFRLKVRDYRVLYEVDNETKTVTILYIRHMQTIYKQLKRL